MKKKSNFDNGSDLSGIFNGNEFFQPYKMFYLLNNTPPNVVAYENIDWYVTEEKVSKFFKVNKSDLFVIQQFDAIKKRYFTFYSAIAVRKNLILICDSNNLNLHICIFYNSETDKTLLNKLEEIVLDSEIKENNSGHLFLLQRNSTGHISLEKYPIKAEIDGISDCYNDDFSGVHQTIINRLDTENDKGLVLLHGLPGTGKTSYIRYLATVLKKRIIFIPPDLMQMISSPECLSIFNQYPNSIVVIEDAENIIEQRKGGTNSAVSNLLNMTDGLLSECLKIQILCTFNTDISKVDSALLRKGRLIARYEFKKLAKEKAQQLSNKLGFKNVIANDMPLTDIVNQEKNYHNDDDEKSIGFKMVG